MEKGSSAKSEFEDLPSKCQALNGELATVQVQTPVPCVGCRTGMRCLNITDKIMDSRRITS